MYFVLETFLTSQVDFCTLSIISESKETPCNILRYVSTCLAFEEKNHDWDLWLYVFVFTIKMCNTYTIN